MGEVQLPGERQRVAALRTRARQVALGLRGQRQPGRPEGKAHQRRRREQSVEEGGHMAFCR